MAPPVNKLRVLVLMHPDLVPPDDVGRMADQRVAEMKTEYDVVQALEKLGHTVIKLGVTDEIRAIRTTIEREKPHVVWNLLEEFQGEAVLDQNVVAYLELMGVPYTGNNPRGLLLARDKALSKQLLAYHRIRVPRFAVFPRSRKVKRPRRLEFPLIVKALDEDSSIGISQASIVHDDEKLVERVAFVHDKVRSNAIAEQFIPGRDVYVAVIGNDRLLVLPPQELVFKNKEHDDQRIATEKAKHDVAYQEKWGIDVTTSKELAGDRRVVQLCKRIYRTLRLEGYARLDFRQDADGHLWFLEANPNPDIARYEEVACAAEVAGIAYEELIQRFLGYALQRGRAR